MYFRCTDCYGATWVQDASTSTSSRVLNCRSCGRGFTIQQAPILQADAGSQYETALALAEGNGLDLPTSYSVMLGIMTLEHATLLRDRGLPAEGDPKPGAAADEPEKDRETSVTPLPTIEHDPAFDHAVRQGYLSVQQAIERGERAKYARRLIDRHGLTESLAYLVADNRTSLSSALQKDREEVAEILRPVKRAIWKKATVAVMGSLAVVAVGIYGIQVWSKIEAKNRKVEAWAETVSAKQEKTRAEQPREPDRTPGSVPPRRVRMLSDDFGRLVEVDGPDPSSVLLAYCANRFPGSRLQPIELTSGIPPRSGSRLGVFEDRQELGKRFAIKIRREIRGSRWIAGDGVQPITAIEAPELPPNARRTPLLINAGSDSDS